MPYASTVLFVTCENSDDLPYIRAASRRRLTDHRNDYGHSDTSSDMGAIKNVQGQDRFGIGTEVEDPKQQRQSVVRLVNSCQA
jgi:hypothetical protein